jgi:uracil-DNA glycosylase
MQNSFLVNLPEQTLKQIKDLRYNGKIIFPEEKLMFKALELTPIEKVKVVILAQDCYHGERQANGLAFSVNRGEKIPPSLQNIFLELCTDLDIPVPSHGDLTKWAEQGVLLLNSVLTVEKGKPGSHFGIGWEDYTNNIIKKVNQKQTPVVFMLWGKKAQEKSYLIDNSIHLVLTASHPSPLSAYRGFLGCGCFSECNKFLESRSISGIDWRLE